MAETNPAVIQPEVLLTRVRENVLHIPAKRNDTGVSKQVISLAEKNLRQMESNLNSMHRNAGVMDVTWQHQIRPIQSNRGLIGPLIVFIKRAIRKAIFWFVQPYVDQQTAFNGAATRALEDSIKIQEALLAELKRQR